MGAKALKSIPGVTVVEEENVPETNAVTQTMESMIKVDGAKLLFPTSFGYFDPFMVDAAKNAKPPGAMAWNVLAEDYWDLYTLLLR